MSTRKLEKLNKKQEGFAKDYIDTGNATVSVKNNYDVSNDNSAAAMGSRMLRSAKIQEYIEDKAEVAASTVFEIVQFGESDQARLSASKDILDRAGFKPIERSQNINLNLDVKSTERTRELGNRIIGLFRR